MAHERRRRDVTLVRSAARSATAGAELASRRPARGLDPPALRDARPSAPRPRDAFLTALPAVACAHRLRRPGRDQRDLHHAERRRVRRSGEHPAPADRRGGLAPLAGRIAAPARAQAPPPALPRRADDPLRRGDARRRAGGARAPAARPPLLGATAHPGHHARHHRAHRLRRGRDLGRAPRRARGAHPRLLQARVDRAAAPTRSRPALTLGALPADPRANRRPRLRDDRRPPARAPRGGRGHLLDAPRCATRGRLPDEPAGAARRADHRCWWPGTRRPPPGSPGRSST